jgi:hypothetical protein
VVGIAGPGDPFASPEDTLETLRLVRKRYPEMLLCVASNGLEVAAHAAELAKLQVSHVTLTVNAVDPEIGARSTPGSAPAYRVLRGVDGAAALLERQRARLSNSSGTASRSRSTPSSCPASTTSTPPRWPAKWPRWARTS